MQAAAYIFIHRKWKDDKSHFEDMIDYFCDIREPLQLLLFPEGTDLTGKVAENALVAADITVNKNMVPFDSRSAFQTSGIRLGTPAITTRGAKEDLMVQIAAWIEEVLNDPENEQVIASVRAKVNEKMKDYPLFAY